MPSRSRETAISVSRVFRSTVAVRMANPSGSFGGVYSSGVGRQRGIPGECRIDGYVKYWHIPC